MQRRTSRPAPVSARSLDEEEEATDATDDTTPRVYHGDDMERDSDEFFECDVTEGDLSEHDDLEDEDEEDEDDDDDELEDDDDDELEDEDDDKLLLGSVSVPRGGSVGAQGADRLLGAGRLGGAESGRSAGVASTGKAVAAGAKTAGVHGDVRRRLIDGDRATGGRNSADGDIDGGDSSRTSGGRGGSSSGGGGGGFRGSGVGGGARGVRDGSDGVSGGSGGGGGGGSTAARKKKKKMAEAASAAAPSPRDAAALGSPGGIPGGATEEEILAQIHRLHLELESVREGGDGGRDANGGGLGDGGGGDGVGGAEGGAGRGDGDAATGLRTPRLIVVSNRLPMSMSKDASSGDWEFRVSSGGLVSALAGVKNQIPFVWVGWTGVEVATADQGPLRQRLVDEMSCYPVFLSDQDANDYYNGFCNDVLWPLFHYVPLPILSHGGERKFDFKYWAAYSRANHRFAEAVMQVYQPGDLVWVQDYHLMLLPSLLRKRLRDVMIGFFLHTPFPSSEVYRILPVRNKILQGVLAADLIGFHTYDYARHFLSVCTRILGLEASPKGVNYKNRFAHVGIFPIGIDPTAFTTALETQSVRDHIAMLTSRFKGKKVLLGVDRLDYIKGIPHKLMAFETLLARHPEWKGKVVLIQIAVPSRTEVDAYKALITQTNELVGRINGKYSSFEYSPIVFMNQSVSFNHLCALYSLADVAVVTSIRDGMNLVSYEYVMCQKERHGVLVLSEFAGSAQSLSSAIRVNPWNIEELASALHEALSVTERERELKHWKLYHYVTKHTASFWAHSFVSEMQQIESQQQSFEQHVAPQSLLRVRIDILPELRYRSRRLILMDFEGTICPPAALAELAFPTPSIKRFLFRLSSDPRNSVYIMSGRSKFVLDNWFGDLDVGLIAEHGCDFRHPRHPAWEPIVGHQDPTWRDGVIPILQYFCERTPGAHLELKDKIITWHFRDADPIFGSWQSKELQLHLAEACSSLSVELVSGPKYLELRPVGVNRVAAVQRIVAELPEPKVDFVFAIGADKGDEEVFSYLNQYVREPDGSCVTLCCRVGENLHISAADRYIPDAESALRNLKELAPSTANNVKKSELRGSFAGPNRNTVTGVGNGVDASIPPKRKGPVAALRQVQRSASYDAILGQKGPISRSSRLQPGTASPTASAEGSLNVGAAPQQRSQLSGPGVHAPGVRAPGQAPAEPMLRNAGPSRSSSSLLSFTPPVTATALANVARIPSPRAIDGDEKKREPPNTAVVPPDL